MIKISRSMSMVLIRMVASPTVIPAKRLIIYGTLEMGEVPRSAMMERATPNAITTRPEHRRRDRLRSAFPEIGSAMEGIAVLCSKRFYGFGIYVLFICDKRGVTDIRMRSGS